MSVFVTLLKTLFCMEMNVFYTLSMKTNGAPTKYKQQLQKWDDTHDVWRLCGYNWDWNRTENGNLCTRLSFCTLWPRRSWQALRGGQRVKNVSNSARGMRFKICPAKMYSAKTAAVYRWTLLASMAPLSSTTLRNRQWEDVTLVPRW